MKKEKGNDTCKKGNRDKDPGANVMVMMVVAMEFKD